MNGDYWEGMEGLWRPVCLRRDFDGKTSLELEKGESDYFLGYPSPEREGSIMLIAYPRSPLKRWLLGWVLK
jgi:hypothetical protein